MNIRRELLGGRLRGAGRVSLNGERRVAHRAFGGETGGKEATWKTEA